MNQKPVAVMGATPGFVGTARAQLQLRQTLSYNKGRVLPRREVLVARAHKKFDVDGQLTEAKSHDFIRSLLARLYNWTLFLKGEVGPDEQVLVANES